MRVFRSSRRLAPIVQPEIRRVVVGSLGLMAVVGSSAYAADIAFGYGYAGEYSSNMTAVSSDTVSAWAHSAIVGAGIHVNTVELLAAMRAQGEYRTYSPAIYNDENLYFVDASALWTISPERFTWTTTDRYDYGILNPTVAATPANRTSYNVFETGPDLYARLGARNRLSLAARYGALQYDELQSSNKRHSGAVRWLYELSAATEFSANYEVEKVKYDNDEMNTDYTRRDESLRVDSRQGRSRFDLEGGRTTIERNGFADTKGRFWRLNWVREITPEKTAGIRVSREWSDAGTVALGTVTNPADPTGSTGTAVSDTASGDIFLGRSAEAFYLSNSGQLLVDVRFFGRDLDYERAPMDERSSGARARLEHNPEGTLASYVFGSRTKRHFIEFAEDDVDREIGLGCRYRIRRNVNLVLEATKWQRTSNLSALEYTDNRLFISVFYSSGPWFTPAPRRR